MTTPSITPAAEANEPPWWDRFGTWASIVAAAVAIFAAGVSTFGAVASYGTQRASFYFSNLETAKVEQGSILFHVRNCGRLGAEHIFVKGPDDQPIAVQPSMRPDGDLQIATGWKPNDKKAMWFTIEYNDPFVRRTLKLCVDVDGGGRDVHECRSTHSPSSSWAMIVGFVLLLMGLLALRRRRLLGG